MWWSGPRSWWDTHCHSSWRGRPGSGSRTGSRGARSIRARRGAAGWIAGAWDSSAQHAALALKLRPTYSQRRGLACAGAPPRQPWRDLRGGRGPSRGGPPTRRSTPCRAPESWTGSPGFKGIHENERHEVWEAPGLAALLSGELAIRQELQSNFETCFQTPYLPAPGRDGPRPRGITSIATSPQCMQEA